MCGGISPEPQAGMSLVSDRRQRWWPRLKPPPLLCSWWQSQGGGTRWVSRCRRRVGTAQLGQLVLTPLGVVFFGLYVYSAAPFSSFWRNKMPPSLAVWGKTIRKHPGKIIAIKQAGPTRRLPQGDSRGQRVGVVDAAGRWATANGELALLRLHHGLAARTPHARL